MKIIDKKGRLFGVINLIDLLFILLVVGAVVFGVKRVGGTRVANEPAQPGHMTLMVRNVRKVTVDNIKPGDKLYHYDKGVYLGEITDVRVEPLKDTTEYQGQFILAEVPDKYEVYIDVKAEVSENDQTYTIGGEQIKIGNEYRVKSKTSAFFGTCVGVGID